MATAFEALCAAYSGDDRIQKVRQGLRIGGKVFAMQVKGQIAMKLPAKRIAALAAAGKAKNLVMGGREMAEWAVITKAAPAVLAKLAEEAAEFVAAGD